MNPWQEIGTNVYRRQYEHLDLNVGAVIGSEGLLVVDTRASHHQGRELQADLKKLTRLPVRWVVNTHFHWDHCWENAVFQSAELWGHVNCRHELEVNGERARAELLKRTSEDVVTIKKQLEAVDIVPPVPSSNPLPRSTWGIDQSNSCISDGGTRTRMSLSSFPMPRPLSLGIWSKKVLLPSSLMPTRSSGRRHCVRCSTIAPGPLSQATAARSIRTSSRVNSRSWRQSRRLPTSASQARSLSKRPCQQVLTLRQRWDRHSSARSLT